jgi:DNA-directed RNA polymerase subunit RPC12/RpoP
MSGRKVICPQCDEVVTLDDEEARVRCPDCRTVISVPRKRKAQSAKPLRRKRRKGMPIGWIVGGTVLLVAVVVGAVVAVGAFRGRAAVAVGGGGNAAGGSDSGVSFPNLFSSSGAVSKPVTKDDLPKIKGAMSLEEVQAILGPGKVADENDMKVAFGNRSMHSDKGPPEEQWMNNGRMASVTSWYQWRSDDFSIFVGFGKGKRTGTLKALLSFWVERVSVGGGLYGFRSEPGLMLFGNPDDLTDARAAQDKVIDDPKWKGGNARQLLLGRWKNAFEFGYEFTADGIVKAVGIEKYTSTYRFIDDENIEINVPAFPFQPARIDKMRVLVNKTELILVRVIGERRDLLDYKRVK